MKIVKDELNREYAKKLSHLILSNPTMRVVAWINTEGISDDYAYMAGNLNEPHIQTIAYSEDYECYIKRGGNDYEDCDNFYGSNVDYWDDEKLKQKASLIPWEDVIAVNVSAV